MTNQAAQTMPPLPKSFGEHCVYDSVRIMREPGYTADQMHQYARDYAAALSQTAGVPEGWRLVPIEPNWDMRNEGREFLIDGLHKEPEKLAYFLWKTMVAAAPEVE